MNDAAPARIGVLRPAGAHPVAAEAEARVIRHELVRRLGNVTVDLRIDLAEPLGPWMPLAHASWPADVDALIETDALFGGDHPPLTALFARTVDPGAAAVRRRMLDLLGLAAAEVFDDDALAGLDAMTPSPTDLWLIVGGAGDVAVSDRAVAGFAETATTSIEALDGAFDRVAEQLRSNDAVGAAVGRALERISAERDALRDEVVGLRLELERERFEFAEAIDSATAERAAADLAAGSP